MLASLNVGPVQFDTPFWLWLIPIGWALTIWIGRASLSGLGTITRRVALAVRLVVIAILAAAMAEPQWRNTAKDVAVSVVVDASRSISPAAQADIDRYIPEAARAHKKDDDRLGVTTVAVDAIVQSLPSKLVQGVEKQNVGPGEGTNLDAGLRLALAVRPPDAAYRVVIATDGNETAGSLLAAAQAAKASGIPIDVLPMRYAFDREVVMDPLVAPPTARMGETVNVRIALNATKPAKGRVSLLLNGDPVDLDPDSEGFGMVVDLAAGPNTFSVPVKVARAGPQQFEAVFEPLADAAGVSGDAIPENNRQLAVTFVTSEGRTLVVTEAGAESEHLIAALTESRIATESRPADQFPTSLTELASFDAVILVNEPAYNFSQEQQENLRQYVHDAGGGLVMVGGPQSFGAGGWIGSPLEDALPIRLDPPNKRQMPKGALVLVMHSIEMPDGVFFGKKTATAAVDALSRLDEAGIIEYTGRGGGAEWVHPLTEIGDGTAIKRAINRLVFGDMPSYDASLLLALSGLEKSNAAAKHIIMISDGDASLSTRTVQQIRKAGITVSTVGVYPHNQGDLVRLKDLADQTKGRYYQVVNQNGLNNIVQIFIKEAQTVKRSLIWEGPPFQPAVAGTHETMRGIPAVQPISGYVVAADREGLSTVTLRGKENDPILALWQHGLGRVITFTSDASTKWAAAWVPWPQFRAFWEQHVRWAMRPSGNANIRVTTVEEGEHTRLIVDATDASGERLNFARFSGRVATPDGKGADLDLRQIGPGRYEGVIDSRAAGTYIASLRYRAPSPGGGDTPIEGTIQTAISRPFADEFKALKDNEPLLRQVAELTGGMVLSGDPNTDNPWRREDLKMPVATTPIWLAFALAGIGLFLADVGVRRVRIDIPAIARAILHPVRAMSRDAKQMDTLRSAREKARRQMAEPAPAQAAPPPPTAADKAAAKVKFEASPEALKAARPESPVSVKIEQPKPRPGAAKDQPEEESLSRLRKAKQRARDELGEGEKE